MLCLVHYLFIISTSVIDCLGRFVPEMTYYVLSGTFTLPVFMARVHGWRIWHREHGPWRRIVWTGAVCVITNTRDHGPCSRAVITDVILDTRVHGPW